MNIKMDNESWIDHSFWSFKGKHDFIDQWFLMSSPVPIVTITMLYLLFVLKIGPEYMKKIPPYNLNTVLLLYNGIQVLISCYLFAYGLYLIMPQGLINSKCFMEHRYSTEIATGMYFYLLAKISELLDTVFFVLRKKFNQISFLHVYHHTNMMLLSWLFVKYDPVISAAFLGTVNSFVHIVMYAYYGLSTFPSISKYLWWKKYITSMQLVQFVVVILQAMVNFAFSECPPSYTLLFAIVVNGSVFLYLFGNFYMKTYLKKEHRNNVNKVTSEPSSRKDNDSYLNGVNDKIEGQNRRRRFSFIRG